MQKPFLALLLSTAALTGCANHTPYHHNDKDAFYSASGSHYVIALKANVQHNDNVHDPLTWFVNPPFDLSFHITVPRIQGLINVKETSCKTMGTIRIDGDVMTVDLRSGRNGEATTVWNGVYSLYPQPPQLPPLQQEPVSYKCHL